MTLADLPSAFGAVATVRGVPHLIGGWDESKDHHGMRSTVVRVEDCGRSLRVLHRQAPFKPRSFLPATTFNGAIRIFGGYHYAPPSNVLGDIWSSADGFNWTLDAIDPEWEEREAHGVVDHSGQLFLFGGVTYFRPDRSARSGAQNSTHLRLFADVWRSRDGFEWDRVAAKAPWGVRRSFSFASKDGHLWLWGGINDEAKELFNDVWRSADGVHWEKVVARAPWQPRAVMNPVGVFAGKLWVIGGDELYVVAGRGGWRNKGMNDVWSSSDGSDWQLATPAAEFEPRYGAFVFELTCDGQRALGLFGGQNDTYPDGETRHRVFYKDLWTSRDGKMREAISRTVH